MLGAGWATRMLVAFRHERWEWWAREADGYVQNVAKQWRVVQFAHSLWVPTPLNDCAQFNMRVE